MPLQNDTIPYSTLTMFAVGSNSFMAPYSFYDYTTASGFMDTSTLQTVIQSSIVSSIQGNLKTHVSTIPYTQWVSSTTVQTKPFYYSSTFQVTASTIVSSIQQTFPSTVLSTIYAPPRIFYPSGSPIYPNPFVSTYTYLFQSTIPSFVSTSVSFGPIVSTGVLAASYPFDFITTSSDNSYPILIRTPNVWLGDTVSQWVNSKQYTISVNCQYSLLLSSSTTSYTWVSTTAYLGNAIGSLNQIGLTGPTATTRVGDRTYTQITNTFSFSDSSIGLNTSNFFLGIVLQSSITETSSNAPTYDLFIPGNTNFTFTCVPK